MTLRRSVSWIALLLALVVAVPPAAAQVPRMISVYEILDVGDAPVQNCSCIGAPFTLPLMPGPDYASGAASPLHRPELSAEQRARAARAQADERARIGLQAEHGLAGNPASSLSVALFLSVEAAIVQDSTPVDAETVRWLHLAATQEQHDAFRLLGYHYAHGRGVAQDYGAAAYWFAQGARRDDPISMTALGLLLATGRGVPQDWDAAVRWWQRAQSRTPLAGRFAADAYACGLGTPLDLARAAATYKSVAERELSASVQLGHMYVNRCADGGDDAAVKAFQGPADQGMPDAQIALSELVREGRGTDPNPYQAYTLARFAELRLPDGPLKALAAEQAKRAERLTMREALVMQERMIQDMIARAAKPIR